LTSITHFLKKSLTFSFDSKESVLGTSNEHPYHPIRIIRDLKKIDVTYAMHTDGIKT